MTIDEVDSGGSMLICSRVRKDESINLPGNALTEFRFTQK